MKNLLAGLSVLFLSATAAQAAEVYLSCELNDHPLQIAVDRDNLSVKIRRPTGNSEEIRNGWVHQVVVRFWDDKATYRHTDMVAATPDKVSFSYHAKCLEFIADGKPSVCEDHDFSAEIDRKTGMLSGTEWPEAVHCSPVRF